MTNNKQKEFILNEIAQQVIKLDYRRKSDADLRQKIEDHVDALAEMTTLEKSEIDQMAQAICAEYQNENFKLSAVKRFIKQYYWAVSAVAVVLFIGLVWMEAQFSGYRSGVRDTSPAFIDTVENHRDIYLRSSVAQVLGRLSSLKVMFAEEYMVTGKYPSSFKQMGIDNTKFNDKLIRDLEILPEGRLKANLSSNFGEDRYLILTSSVDEALGHFSWKCTTNIPQESLGAKSAAPCVNEEI